LILTIPERLAYVRILVPKDLIDKAINKLQELNTIHVEVVGKIPEEDRRKILSDVKRLEEVEKIISAIEKYIEMPTLIEIKEYLTPTVIRKRLYSLYEKLRQVLKNAESLTENISRLESKLRYEEELLDVLEVLSNVYGLGNATLDYLNFRGEVISAVALMGRPQNISEFKTYLIEESRKRQLSVYIVREYRINEDIYLLQIIIDTQLMDIVNNNVKKFNLRIVEFPKVSMKINDFLTNLKDEVQELKRELNEARTKLSDLVKNVINDLALAKVYVNVVKEQLDAILAALMSEYLVGIEGWIPISNMHLIEDVLYKELKHVYVAKLSTNKKPPTKMKNPKPLKAFELITKIYGVPNYNEWDPTPILAYSLMLFFGLMFADFIYGLALLIIVMFVLERLGLVENPYSEGYLTFKRLLIALSLSSMFFGVLSNSFAGYSVIISSNGISLVPASTKSAQLAILPLINPMFFIKLALIIGLIHVNIGHVLALIKYWKKRVMGDFISKVGFFIAEVFGIPYVLNAFIGVKLPGILGLHPEYLLYGALAGLGVLIAGKFIAYRGLAILFWLFDITGLLGDVMSYTRLAGIGLATTLLAQNFNSIALSIASTMGYLIPIKILGLIIGVLVSIIIMFLANLLNLAFGVLGAFIHSLRLCFVEFLPKFYEGEGREFKPLAIRIERAVIVGRR